MSKADELSKELLDEKLVHFKIATAYLSGVRQSHITSLPYRTNPEAAFVPPKKESSKQGGGEAPAALKAEAVASDPRRPVVLEAAEAKAICGVAAITLLKEDPFEAIKLCNTALLKLGCDKLECLCLRANAHVAIGSLSDAQKDLTEAVRLVSISNLSEDERARALSKVQVHLWEVEAKIKKTKKIKKKAYSDAFAKAISKSK